MNMNIYISPHNEKNLREMAARGRSMSGIINTQLEKYFAELEGRGVIEAEKPEPEVAAQAPTPVSQEVKDSSNQLPEQSSPRRKADVLAEIKQLEKDVVEQLEYNQDPESRKRIEGETAFKIEKLWVEYRELEA